MRARHPAEPLAGIAVLMGLVTFGAMIAAGAFVKAGATAPLVYFAWRCGFARPFAALEVLALVMGVTAAGFGLWFGR